MEHNENKTTAVLNPIFDVIAEDRQKIKELTEKNQQLKAENANLLSIANEYIAKCDELSAQNKRLQEVLYHTAERAKK